MGQLVLFEEEREPDKVGAIRDPLGAEVIVQNLIC
jgi:hypothetical protein